MAAETTVLEAEIARRQVLEADLRRWDAALDDFFENAAECLHQVGADGTLMWANKAELNMLGYEVHKYIGYDSTEFHADQASITDSDIDYYREKRYTTTRPAYGARTARSKTCLSIRMCGGTMALSALHGVSREILPNASAGKRNWIDGWKLARES
jgi:hypothetical protein